MSDLSENVCFSPSRWLDQVPRLQSFIWCKDREVQGSESDRGEMQMQEMQSQLQPYQRNLKSAMERWSRLQEA